MIDFLIDRFVGDLQLSLWFAMVGLVLVLAEALIPGGPLIVAGTALLAAGVTGQLFGINGLLPLTVLLGVYGGIAFVGFMKFDLYGERGEQTSEADTLEGEKGVVKETVTAGDGEVKLDSGGFNPFFVARSHTGQTIPEGTRIRVVDSGGGNVLEVERVSDRDTSQDADDESPADK